MFKGISGKRRTGTVPVYLNVYDLTPINGYAYWLGLGVYHSGVQVHGVEYAYGAHEHSTSGIFMAEPRQCPGFRFRKSILIGNTNLSPQDVHALMDELAVQYTGSSYNLISKNCNHFCNDACLRLVSKPIPKWVNRLAKIGFLCNCVLPVQVSAVRHKGEEGRGDRAKLRSNSTRYPLTGGSSGGGSGEFAAGEGGGAATSKTMFRSLSLGSRNVSRNRRSSSSSLLGLMSATTLKA